MKDFLQLLSKLKAVLKCYDNCKRDKKTNNLFFFIF